MRNRGAPSSRSNPSSTGESQAQFVKFSRVRRVNSGSCGWVSPRRGSDVTVATQAASPIATQPTPSAPVEDSGVSGTYVSRAARSALFGKATNQVGIGVGVVAFARMRLHAMMGHVVVLAPIILPSERPVPVS